MKQFMIKLIRFYQKYISPLSNPSCRYIPTCSHYAIEAIETHGALKGGYLAAKRLLRCNPWGDRIRSSPTKVRTSSHQRSKKIRLKLVFKNDKLT